MAGKGKNVRIVAETWGFIAVCLIQGFSRARKKALRMTIKRKIKIKGRRGSCGSQGRVMVA
jgi:hypothetical protein